MRTSIRIRAVMQHVVKVAVAGTIAFSIMMVAFIAIPSFTKTALAHTMAESPEVTTFLPRGATPLRVEQQIIIGTPAPLLTVRRNSENPSTAISADSHVVEATAEPTAAPTGDGPPPALGPTATPTPIFTPSATPTSTSDVNAEVTAAGGSTIPVGYGRAGQIWSTMKPGYYEKTVFPIQGISTYYNPGIMEQVLEYRFRARDITDCPECIGYIALVRAGDINRRVWMQMDDGTVEGPFLVTDCAGRNHVARLLRIGWGVDVDWQTAQRWEMKMRNVTLLDAPPEEWVQTIATVGDRREALARATTTPAAIAQAAPSAVTTPLPAREIEALPVHPAEREVEIDAPTDASASEPVAAPNSAPTATPAPQAVVPLGGERD